MKIGLNKFIVSFSVVLCFVLVSTNQLIAVSQGSDSLTITSPQDSSTIGGTTQLSWQMVDSDQAAVNYIVDIFNGQCSTNGSNIGKITKSGANQSDSAYTFDWDTSAGVNGTALTEGANYCVRFCGFFNDPASGYYNLCEKISVKYSASATSNTNPEIKLSSNSVNYNVGENISISVSAQDADGDALVYSLTSGADFLTMDSTTGVLTGSASEPGTYNLVIKVEDAKGGADTASLVVNILSEGSEVTQPPAVSDTLTLVTTSPQQNSTITETKPQISANFSMPAGGALNALVTSVSLDGAVDNLNCTVNTDNILCELSDSVALGSHTVAIETALDGETEVSNFSWNFTISTQAVNVSPTEEGGGSNTILIAILVVVVGAILIAVPWAFFHFRIKKKKDSGGDDLADISNVPDNGLPPTLSDDPLGLAGSNPVMPPTDNVIGDNQLDNFSTPVNNVDPMGAGFDQNNYDQTFNNTTTQPQIQDFSQQNQDIAQQSAAPIIGENTMPAPIDPTQMDSQFMASPQVAQPQDFPPMAEVSSPVTIDQASIPTIGEQEFVQPQTIDQSTQNLNPQITQTPDTFVQPVSEMQPQAQGVAYDPNTGMGQDPMSSPLSNTPVQSLTDDLMQDLPQVNNDLNSTQSNPSLGQTPNLDMGPGVQTPDIAQEPMQTNPLADLDTMAPGQPAQELVPPAVDLQSQESNSNLYESNTNVPPVNESLLNTNEEMQLPELYRSDDIPPWLQDSTPDTQNNSQQNAQPDFINPVDMAEGAKVHDPFGISLNNDDVEGNDEEDSSVSDSASGFS